MKNHKTGLFLMELIVGILFFALASAICIQIFTKAKLMNDESENTYQAARLASNIIEVYKENKLDEYYQVNQSGYLYYDENWQITTNNKAPYHAYIQIHQQTITILITYQDKTLYEINYMHHQQKTF